MGERDRRAALDSRFREHEEKRIASKEKKKEDLINNQEPTEDVNQFWLTFRDSLASISVKLDQSKDKKAELDSTAGGAGAASSNVTMTKYMDDLISVVVRLQESVANAARFLVSCAVLCYAV